MAEAKRSGQNYKVNGLEIKRGNAKIHEDTLIYNMTPAFACPSDRRGFCKVSDECYAKNSERLYKNVYKYRVRQMFYWKTAPLTRWFADLEELFHKHKKAMSKVKFFRFNESGDFKNQGDVDKADIIAEYLWRRWKIQAYTHSCRKDLDFSRCVRLLVKSSGYVNGNNGYTYFMKIKDKALRDKLRGAYIDSSTYVCGMKECKSCDVCKTKNNTTIIWTR